MSRWTDFSDRELRHLYQALVDHESRTAEKLVDELITEADERGAYRARHIIVRAGEESARTAAEVGKA